MAYNTLNKLKWTRRLGEAEVVIIHRGAPEGKKIIFGMDITEIKKSYLMYNAENEETFIPLHRVLEIRLKGKVLWKRKSKT